MFPSWPETECNAVEAKFVHFLIVTWSLNPSHVSDNSPLLLAWIQSFNHLLVFIHSFVYSFIQSIDIVYYYIYIVLYFQVVYTQRCSSLIRCILGLCVQTVLPWNTNILHVIMISMQKVSSCTEVLWCNTATEGVKWAS